MNKYRHDFEFKEIDYELIKQCDAVLDGGGAQDQVPIDIIEYPD